MKSILKEIQTTHKEYERAIGILLFTLLVLASIFSLLPNGGCGIGTFYGSKHCQHHQWAQFQDWIGQALVTICWIFPTLLMMRNKANPAFTAILGALLYTIGVGLNNAIDKNDINNVKLRSHWLRVASPLAQNFGIGLGVATLAVFFV